MKVKKCKSCQKIGGLLATGWNTRIGKLSFSSTVCYLCAEHIARSRVLIDKKKKERNIDEFSDNGFM